MKPKRINASIPFSNGGLVDKSVESKKRKWKAGVLIGSLLFVFLLSSGCMEDFNKGFDEFFSPQDKFNEQSIQDPDRVEIPVLSYEADKVVYYYCDDNSFEYCLTGWNKFASFSEKYLRCQVKSIDEPLVGNTLPILVEQGVSVQVLFDRKSTYTDNGYPRENSQYGHLLSELVDVQNGVVTESFCLNEKGVLFSLGFEPSKAYSQPNSSFYVIYSTGLSEVLNTRFFKNYSWGN